MNALGLLRAVENKPVFKVSDIRRLLKSDEYAKVFLNRLVKRNIIKRVTKNVYTTHSDAHLVSSHIAFPSYISFWSASSFLGYTDQMLNSIQVATTRKVKSLIFEGYSIKFIPIKYFFGYKKITTQNGEIFVADEEKLIIDCLIKYKELGNFDEIIKVIMNAKIDEKKMADYLERTKNDSLIKRAGYLLETYRKIDLRDKFKLDNNYIILDSFLKKGKKKNKKWRVII